MALTWSQRSERWEIDDQVWSRDPATGAFDLADHRGLGAPPATCHPLDLAPLIGARVSNDPDDRRDRPAALYPAAFEFSPITGQPLPAPAASHMESWLPPFGGDRAWAEMPQGLRLTAARLALPPTPDLDAQPDHELPMPPAGDHQFLVGAFGTRDARLIALDPAQGLMHHWLPHSGAWAELRPSGMDALAGSSLGDRAWGMAAQGLRESPRIFMPTDAGLAVVSVNLVGWTYEVHMVGQCCVGAPVLWRGEVHVPMLDDEGKLRIHALNLRDGTAVHRVEGQALDASAEWFRPVADRHRVVWVGPTGQWVVERREGNTSTAFLLPWSQGTVPCFDSGSPCVSGDGQLWQRCVRHDGQDEEPVFVQLGVGDPAVRAVRSSRSSGYRLDEHLEDDAAFDDLGDGLDSAPHEQVFPLLESPSASAVLCARVQSTHLADELLASGETFTTTFELDGRHRIPLWTARVPRPWATRPFIYAGHLYLYHPDKRHLHGWRLAP